MNRPSDAKIPEQALEEAEKFRQEHDSAVLTVAFTDIAKSTELREKLGEREYERLREEHELELAEIVSESSAGQIVKGMGDGALIVFEKPSVAVARLLDVQESMSDHKHFRLRVGVDLGEVSRKGVGPVVSDVFGRHVNRASRIQALAQPGHVLASYNVYDSSALWLKDQGIDWRYHGQHDLKGFAAAQPIYEPFKAGKTPQEAVSTVTDVAASSQASPEVVFYQGSFSLRSEDRRQPMASRGGATPQPSRPRIRNRSLEAAVKSGGDVLGWFSEKIAVSAKKYSRRFGFSPSILWVDDFPDNNRMLVELLRTSCEVSTVTSTEQAVERLRNSKYALVISDMGRGDNPRAGLDLLKDLGTHKRYTPAVIFASLNAVSRFGAQARQFGALICTSGFATLLDSIDQVVAWWARRTAE